MGGVLPDEGGQYGSLDRAAFEQGVFHQLALFMAGHHCRLKVLVQHQGTPQACVDVSLVPGAPEGAWEALVHLREEGLYVPMPGVAPLVKVCCQQRAGERPAGCVQVTLKGVPAALHVQGLVAQVLSAAGYTVGSGQGTTSVQVDAEFFGESGLVPGAAAADVVVAFVRPPLEDVKLARLPAFFHCMGEPSLVHVFVAGRTVPPPPAAWFPAARFTPPAPPPYGQQPPIPAAAPPPAPPPPPPPPRQAPAPPRASPEAPPPTRSPTPQPSPSAQGRPGQATRPQQPASPAAALRGVPPGGVAPGSARSGRSTSSSRAAGYSFQGLISRLQGSTGVLTRLDEYLRLTCPALEAPPQSHARYALLFDFAATPGFTQLLGEAVAAVDSPRDGVPAAMDKALRAFLATRDVRCVHGYGSGSDGDAASDSSSDSGSDHSMRSASPPPGSPASPLGGPAPMDTDGLRRSLRVSKPPGQFWVAPSPQQGGPTPGEAAGSP